MFDAGKNNSGFTEASFRKRCIYDLKLNSQRIGNCEIKASDDTDILWVNYNPSHPEN